MKLEQLTKRHHTIPYHTSCRYLLVEDEEARRRKAGASRRKQPLCYGLGSFRGSSRPRSMYSAEEPRFPRRLAFSFGRVPVGIVRTPFSLSSVKRGIYCYRAYRIRLFFFFGVEVFICRGWRGIERVRYQITKVLVFLQKHLVDRYIGSC